MFPFGSLVAVRLHRWGSSVTEFLHFPLHRRRGADCHDCPFFIASAGVLAVLSVFCPFFFFNRFIPFFIDFQPFYTAVFCPFFFFYIYSFLFLWLSVFYVFIFVVFLRVFVPFLR